MANNKKEGLKDDSKNWYADRYQFVVIQRNILALVTLMALVCSIAATFSISQLMPLKSVEPFVIQIDQKSGVTQVVDPLRPHDLTANESVNDYFMVQYIRSRESYLGGELDANWTNYNTVRVLSENKIFNDFKHEIILSNPESPGARLGATGSRSVHIGSIKFLEKKNLPTGEEVRRYLIKVQVTERGGASAPKILQKLIFMEFEYAELDMSIQDRYVNPLGFRVLNYRVDEDNLTQ